MPPSSDRAGGVTGFGGDASECVECERDRGVEVESGTSLLQRVAVRRVRGSVAGRLLPLGERWEDRQVSGRESGEDDNRHGWFK